MLCGEDLVLLMLSSALSSNPVWAVSCEDLLESDDNEFQVIETLAQIKREVWRNGGGIEDRDG